MATDGSEAGHWSAPAKPGPTHQSMRRVGGVEGGANSGHDKRPVGDPAGPSRSSTTVTNGGPTAAAVNKKRKKRDKSFNNFRIRN